MSLFRSEKAHDIFQFNGYLVQYNPDTNCIDPQFPDLEIESIPVDELVSEPSSDTGRSAAFIRIVGQLICKLLGMSPTYLEVGMEMQHVMGMLNEYAASGDGTDVPDLELPSPTTRKKKSEHN